MVKERRKISGRQRLMAIARVARITYRASPLAVFMKLGDTIIQAVLPIATTFFAALTTTALAEAFAGDESAGGRALWFVAVTALLGVLMTAWTSVQQYVNELIRYKIDAAISDQMYEQFGSLDFWRYDDKRTADVYERAKKFSDMFPYAFDQLASILSSLVTLLFGLIALIFVSWWLAVIALVAIVPGVIIQLKLSRKQTDHWRNNIDTRRKQWILEDQLSNIKSIAEIRLYGLLRRFLDLRIRLRDTDEKRRIEFERTYIWRLFASDVLEAGAEVTALVYTALQIIAQAQPVGQFLFVQQIMSRVLSGSSGLTSGISRIDEDLANLFDYNEFMGLPRIDDRQTKLKAPPRSIRFDDVSFHYHGSKAEVLRHISMSIERGQHIAIVGENGAGKSTLIKLLLGMYQPTSGTILLDGVDLQTIDTSSWLRHIGVLQQEFNLYTFATAEENITYGSLRSGRSKKAFDAAIDKAEARIFLEKLPKGMHTYVMQWMEHDDGTPGVDLSGGQKQRLALARNFYRDSPIIILDEPTSAIDALAEARIFDHLFAEKDKTVITISHRLTTVKKADAIYVLEDGEIVERGTHAELVAEKGAYYRLFEGQM